MNKKIFVAALLLSAMSTAASAQNIYTGTKTSYAPQQAQYTAVPKGYTAFFVNHVGRHGSRYMTKAGSDSLLFKLFQLAEKQNALTPLGKEWQKNVDWLTQIQSDKYAEITEQGSLEHAGIAARLLKNNASVFQGRGLDVWFTHKLRTQQSAEGFLSSFGRYPKDKIGYFRQADSAETMLRYYDYSPAYLAFVKSSDIKNRVDSIKDSPAFKEAAKSVVAKFFTNNFWKSDGVKTIQIGDKAYKLTSSNIADALFDVYGVGLSTKNELKKTAPNLTWNPPFSEKEGYELGLLNDAKDFLVKGAGTNSQGLQAKIAASLLENFIETSDSIISGKKSKDAILRFTHAEAIAPVATLMAFKSASQSTDQIFQFESVWNPGIIIPMAANIQWIFYKKGTNVLVKFLLNEKEMYLPIKSFDGPYYKWTDVRKFYTQKLKVLGVDTQTDLLSYLIHLQ